MSPRSSRLNTVKLYRCIYCLAEKPADQFNKDHVMPRLVGTFENNFTLVGKVCTECNGAFGRALEDAWAVDSIVAYLRFASGAKVSDSLPRLFRKRVRTRMGSDPRIEGVRLDVQLSASGGMPAQVIPQIGIRHELEEHFHWYEVDQFLALPAAELSGKKFAIVAPTDGVMEEIISMVRTRVPDFDPRERRREKLSRKEDGTIDMVMTETFDQTLARAVVKIGFKLPCARGRLRIRVQTIPRSHPCFRTVGCWGMASEHKTRSDASLG